jgi:hypothetical protein
MRVLTGATLAMSEFEYGSYAADWEREHPIGCLLTERRDEILDLKTRGACVLPAILDEGTRNFLEAGRRRLAMISGGFPSLEDDADLRGIFEPAMGIHGKPEVVEARAFIAEQVMSLDPYHWGDPIRAAINAGAQVGIHRAMAGQGGKREEEINRMLIDGMLSFLGREFVPAFVRSQAILPAGRTLDFASASMQGTAGDHHDSDLALVVGTKVANVPRYRVVLLQAKKSTGHRIADVSYGEGRQLDGILSTGMGFYLFYPKPTDEGVLPPTVKSAERVFAEARSQYPAMSGVSVAGSHAWDFGTFVAGAMTSRGVRTGRIFPSEDAVVEALLARRTRPLEILMISESSECPIWTLNERILSSGYAQGTAGSLQKALDMARSRPDKSDRRPRI